VDPHSAGEIKAALERLLLSPSLRDQLRAKGLVRAAQFSWDACSRKSLRFFERL
jgi:glycosyltransferase involved in cell wall biosynthesis